MAFVLGGLEKNKLMESQMMELTSLKRSLKELAISMKKMIVEPGGDKEGLIEADRG